MIGIEPPQNGHLLRICLVTIIHGHQQHRPNASHICSKGVSRLIHVMQPHAASEDARMKSTDRFQSWFVATWQTEYIMVARKTVKEMRKRGKSLANVTDSRLTGWTVTASAPYDVYSSITSYSARWSCSSYSTVPAMCIFDLLRLNRRSLIQHIKLSLVYY